MTATKPPPWPHQAAGTAWAVDHPAAYLDVKMGGGKSRMVTDYVDQVGAAMVLIVAPKSVVADVWPNEIPKWSSRPWTVAASTLLGSGTPTKLKRATKLQKVAAFEGRPFAFVVNYDSFRSDSVQEWLKGHRWDVLIYDEVQNLKSPNGVTSKVAARWARLVPRRLGMSGTPLPHSPMDAFGQFRSLDPAVLGSSWWTFRKRYGVLGGFKMKQVIDYQNQDELTARMALIMFSPDPASIDLNLPEAQHVTVSVQLSPKARKVYQALADGLAEEVNGGSINAANGLVKLLRMQQLTSGLAVIDKPLTEDGREPTDAELGAMMRGETEIEREGVDVCTAKQDALADLINGTTEPFVVFGQFRQDARATQAACEAAGASYLELSGQRSDLAAWKAGGAQVLFVQIASGNAGIDLTRARYCAYLSTGFDMGKYLQSLARVHRPGQTRPVTYYHIRAASTVDAYVARALANREDLILSTLAMVAAAHG